MSTTTNKEQKLTFNIRKFRAWAKSLSEGERFRYVDNLNCPIATFYKNLGYEFVSVGSNIVRFDCLTRHPMPERLLKVSRSLSLRHSKNYGIPLTKHDIINAAKD